MNQLEEIMALADLYATQRQHAHYLHETDARQTLRAAIEQALTPGEPVATWENTYGMKEWQVHALRAGWGPKSEWVGLTDEEIEMADRGMCGEREFVDLFARAIEAKLREKNGGTK